MLHQIHAHKKAPGSRCAAQQNPEKRIMIPQEQFDRIQMNASTRAIAEANMRAAASFVDAYCKIAQSVAELFGARPLPKSAYVSQAAHRA